MILRELKQILTLKGIRLGTFPASPLRISKDQILIMMIYLRALVERSCLGIQLTQFFMLEEDLQGSIMMIFHQIPLEEFLLKKYFQNKIWFREPLLFRQHSTWLIILKKKDLIIMKKTKILTKMFLRIGQE